MKQKNELYTLEDLKEFVESSAKTLEEAQLITNDFELDENEFNYSVIALEEQTNRRTLINAQKAMAILLKRKEK